MRPQEKELLPQEKSQTVSLYRHLTPAEIKDIDALEEKSDLKSCLGSSQRDKYLYKFSPKALKPSVLRKSVFQNWGAADVSECRMTEKSHESNPECLARTQRRNFAFNNDRTKTAEKPQDVLL